MRVHAFRLTPGTDLKADQASIGSMPGSALDIARW